MKNNSNKLCGQLSGIEFFTVKIPPEIHRKLALEAEEVGISLNRLVSAKLSR
jgi:predicted HicB family RNase H-like nuclease